MVDVVMHDTQSIELSKDFEGKTFTDLVEVMDNGFLDLKRLKIDHEICNSSPLVIMEEKLTRGGRKIDYINKKTIATEGN